jgi:hypothetical protein
MDKQQKDNEKQMKMHKASYFMYEKTKKECIERMSEAMNPDGSKRWSQEEIDEKIKMIQTMQDDVKEKFLICGGNPADLVIQENNTIVKPTKKPIMRKNVEKDSVAPKKRTPIMRKTKTNEDISQEDVQEVVKEEMKPVKTKTEVKINKKEVEEIPVVPQNWNMSDFSDSFDVIPLPSKGECYDGNMSTIAVSYLTANDENMIVSPNLYRDGLILDYLLRAKIKNNNIDPDDLLEGDREAIILWLRATGYGTKYPITVTDNKTGIEFDTTVDLTQIKHKPFVLKGDINGYFDFTLPVSNDQIKFRFLTHADVKQIEEIEKEEQSNIRKERLIRIVNELNTFIENDDILTKDEKTKLYEAKRNISKWSEKIEVTNDLGYTHTLTNRLELSIVSINGEEDREYISNYVNTMNVRDALALRRYITDNEPGLDYSVMVERPESLGGGSMPVFLSLDEYVFLNIA